MSNFFLYFCSFFLFLSTQWSYRRFLMPYNQLVMEICEKLSKPDEETTAVFNNVFIELYLGYKMHQNYDVPFATKCSIGYHRKNGIITCNQVMKLL